MVLCDGMLQVFGSHRCYLLNANRTLLSAWE